MASSRENLDELCSRLEKDDPTLTDLRLVGKNVGDDGAKSLAQALQTNTTIKNLYLTGNHISDDGAKAFAQALQTNTTLQLLDLHNNQIGDDGAKSLAQALQTNTNLRYIRLHNNQIGDDGAKALAQALQTNTTLQYVYLNDNQIGDDGAKAFAQALQTNTTIKKLYLTDNQISDDGAKALAQALQTNTTIKELYLTDNQIGDDGAKALAQALQTNTTLQGLDLYNNQISDDGAKALAQALQTNTTLQDLYLSYNQIGDDGAKALAQALQTNTTLQYVNLYNNQIGDDGAKALAQALQTNTTIKDLSLSGNQIGDDGAKALAQALQTNTTLQYVNLSNNKIGTDGINAIVAALTSSDHGRLRTVRVGWHCDHATGLKFVHALAEQKFPELDNIDFIPLSRYLKELRLPRDYVDKNNREILSFLRERWVSGKGSRHTKQEALKYLDSEETMREDTFKRHDQSPSAVARAEQLKKAGMASSRVNLDKLCSRLEKDDPTLTYLSLAGENIGDDGAKSLAQALRTNTTLQHLSHSGNQISDDGAKSLAQALQTNTSLRYIRLHNNQIGDDGAKALAKALQTNTTLQYVNLSNNKIGTDGAKALAQALQTNTTLQYVSLSNNKIGANGINAIVAALASSDHGRLRTVRVGSHCDHATGLKFVHALAERKFPKLYDIDFIPLSRYLKELRLPRDYADKNNREILSFLRERWVPGKDSRHTEQEALKYLDSEEPMRKKMSKRLDQSPSAVARAEAASIQPPTADVASSRVNLDDLCSRIEKDDPTLTILCLLKKNIGDDGAKALAQALQTNTTLQELEHGNNQVGDDGAKALAQVLQTNKTLQRLSLSSNQISDDGARALAQALQTNTTLQLLDLNDNQISDDGAKALAQALQTNTTLHGIGLENNKIGFVGINSIVAALLSSDHGTLTGVWVGSNCDRANAARFVHALVEQKFPYLYYIDFVPLREYLKELRLPSDYADQHNGEILRFLRRRWRSGKEALTAAMDSHHTEQDTLKGLDERKFHASASEDLSPTLQDASKGPDEQRFLVSASQNFSSILLDCIRFGDLHVPTSSGISLAGLDANISYADVRNKVQSLVKYVEQLELSTHAGLIKWASMEYLKYLSEWMDAMSIDAEEKARTSHPDWLSATESVCMIDLLLKGQETMLSKERTFKANFKAKRVSMPRRLLSLVLVFEVCVILYLLL